MTCVLVVDDDAALARALRINLTARGYDVHAAPDGRRALDLAARVHPDVVILDLGLPDIDGVTVIAGIRGWSPVPIIVLSARQTSAEKVQALDAGADDYVSKPFSMDELLARVRAAVRRVSAPDGTTDPLVHAASFTIDLAAKKVTRDGTQIKLTPTEWALLDVLARRPGTLVSQRDLLTEIWGPGFEQQTQYLRIYIAQLRRKLEPDPTKPRHLITEAGMGYRFDP
jgi:two-component system, OmpR family, KDP operon response regulator KdpE